MIFKSFMYSRSFEVTVIILVILVLIIKKLGSKGEFFEEFEKRIS